MAWNHVIPQWGKTHKWGQTHSTVCKGTIPLNKVINFSHQEQALSTMWKLLKIIMNIPQNHIYFCCLNRFKKIPCNYLIVQMYWIISHHNYQMLNDLGRQKTACRVRHSFTEYAGCLILQTIPAFLKHSHI